MKNIDKIRSLNHFQLSRFIITRSETICRRYTSSIEGFEKWLYEELDIEFWETFDKDMEYLKYLEEINK